MAFLRNCWYAAAWSSEVDDQALCSRQIIDDDILILRDEGLVRAMSDTCPHRFAPLSLGRRVEAGVQCRYHGLQFGFDGKCRLNPHGKGHIPERVKLHVYPVVERHGLIWVWPGEPGRADPDAIPDLSFATDGSYGTVFGTTVGQGNYELYTDNILDLGHAEFLHTGLAAAAFTLGERRTWIEGSVLRSTVEHKDDLPSEVVQFMLKQPATRFDYWGDITWYAPALMTFHSYYGEPGKPKPDRPSITSFHLFTPETSEVTRYHWAVGRANDVDDQEHSAAIRQGIVHAFDNEDKVMISAQSARLRGRDFWECKPLLLPTDEAAVRARRLLADIIAAEQQSMSTLPQIA